MVDYDDNDFGRARRIVEGLSNEEGRGELARDLEEGVSIADLQMHAQQFYYDANLIENLDLRFPAVRLGDLGLVPVALTEVVRNLRPHFSFPISLWHDYYDVNYVVHALNELRRRGRLGDGETLSPQQARKTFIEKASEFLASRFSAKRRFDGTERPVLTMTKYLGGPTTKVPGCLFSVHTNSPGLSAYWSGAYYVVPNYHGAPTTPAKGVLQAGTYVFGVNGGAYGNNVQWDLNKVCTLPGTASVKLDY